MSASERKARVVYHLVHRNHDGKWHLSVVDGQSDAGAFDTKDQARQEGERLGRQQVEQGGLAQLVVHRQDGSIETEFTYGDDPRDTPG